MLPAMVYHAIYYAIFHGVSGTDSAYGAMQVCGMCYLPACLLGYLLRLFWYWRGVRCYCCALYHPQAYGATAVHCTHYTIYYAICCTIYSTDRACGTTVVMKGRAPTSSTDAFFQGTACANCRSFFGSEFVGIRVWDSGTRLSKHRPKVI
eukprot:1335498-Rhodomonas_salina.2